MKFRSYTPNDENLKSHVNIATPADVGDTVESETKNLTKEALAEHAEKEKEEVVRSRNQRVCCCTQDLNQIGSLQFSTKKT